MKEQEMKDVAGFFYANKIKVHIDMKNGGFYNGTITEFSDTYIVILDRVLGSTALVFSEIKHIGKYWSKK